MTHRAIPLLVAGVLALAACEATTTGNRDNSPAESACVAAVNAEAGSGGALVMASETSGTGTRVLVVSGANQTWSCSVTSGGEVEDVSLAP